MHYKASLITVATCLFFFFSPICNVAYLFSAFLTSHHFTSFCFGAPFYLRSTGVRPCLQVHYFPFGCNLLIFFSEHHSATLLIFLFIYHRARLLRVCAHAFILRVLFLDAHFSTFLTRMLFTCMRPRFTLHALILGAQFSTCHISRMRLTCMRPRPF